MADLLLGLHPLPGAQLVQLRLGAVRPGVLLDQVELGCRDIEDAALRVGDLHIILGHLFHLDLFDPVVNAQSVVLVHHIVPGLQLGKVLDLLPLIGLPPLFLLLPSENIRLRDDREL